MDKLVLFVLHFKFFWLVSSTWTRDLWASLCHPLPRPLSGARTAKGGSVVTSTALSSMSPSQEQVLLYFWRWSHHAPGDVNSQACLDGNLKDRGDAILIHLPLFLMHDIPSMLVCWNQLNCSSSSRRYQSCPKEKVSPGEGLVEGKQRLWIPSLRFSRFLITCAGRF